LSIEELKRNIEDFGKGVERLEQFKAEFEKINVEDHEQEAAEIRNMLKDVSTLPMLETKIANLKDAVSKRKKSNSKYKSISPIKLENKIKQLKQILNKRTGSKTNVTREKLVELHQFPVIEKQISEIKKAVEHLSKRKGSQLTGKDLRNIGDIPKIEEKLNKLRLSIDKKLGENLALDGLEDNIKLRYKSRLKSEVKNAERRIRRRMDQDAEKLETNLSEKYNLEYKNKIKDFELKNVEYLREKENQIRARIEKDTEDDNSGDIENKRNEIKKKLEFEFDRNLLQARKKLNEELHDKFDQEIKKEKDFLKEISQAEQNAKKQEMERKNLQRLEELAKEMRVEIEKRNDEYLKNKESAIRGDKTVNLEKEKKLIREKFESDMQGRIKNLELENAEYLKRREREIKTESEISENEFYQKLQNRDQEIRKELGEKYSANISRITKDLRGEFDRKLSERESYIKQHAQEEIEEKKHEIEDSVHHALEK